MSKNINIAVVGAGGFAFFAVSEFVKIDGVKLVGVYDENMDNAFRFKKIDGSLKIFNSLNELCSDPAVDLVYIATPPYLHYEQSKAALLAGKHVICEKPAAIKLEHAIELKELANQNDVLFVVNLMQRYNGLYAAVAELIKRKVLGEFLHGFFENYASDEFLSAQHWFWDEEKSGGIFIEHGVHFFDMFSGWLGEGTVVASQKINRDLHDNVWDKAQSIVLYQNGLVNFYHAFDQPKVLDRQEMRLQFEKGEITLHEWVPTRLKMNAICSDEDLGILRSIFPNATIEILEKSEGIKTTTGRFKEIKYQYKLMLDSGDTVHKNELYQELVSNMFKDQCAWINNRSHVRKIDENNAVSSLALATKSEQLAHKIYYNCN